MTFSLLRLSVCFLLVSGLSNLDAWGATISDFSTWTLLEDPPDPNFSGTSTSANASLSASGGPIARGTDIGFGSTNGNTVAGSTSGHFFDPGSDFQIAIDYSLTFITPNGFLGLGFGIGEEASGENSAGVAFLTQNGLPVLTFGGAARVNDVDQTPIVLGLGATSSGSLFIDYQAASGDISIGAAPLPGAANPTVSGAFAGLQDQWNDQDLIASFFIRSDGVIPGNQWNSGNANAVFSNFRVLQGTVSAVPEPNSVCLLAAVTAGMMVVRRPRRREVVTHKP